MEKIRQALDRARRNRAEVSIDDADRPLESAPARDQAVTELTGRTADVQQDLQHDERPLAREFVPDSAALVRHRILPPAAAGETGAAVESLRSLRTLVMQRMREHGWQTIGIVSARSADGKTTLAANLAVAIASDPRHTALLVDFDLRQPGVARAFGAHPTVGVEDVLAGSTAIESCLLRPSTVPGLRLLPARHEVSNSSTLVASGRCASLVTELRQRYANRIIVFDLPPVLEADDAVLAASVLDCVLLVITEGHTARADVVQALDLLRGTNVVGTVLNASSALRRARPAA